MTAVETLIPDGDLFTPNARLIDHGTFHSRAAARAATVNAPTPVMIYEITPTEWRAVTLRSKSSRR